MGSGILPNQDRLFFICQPIKMLGSINLNMASSLVLHSLTNDEAHFVIYATIFILL